MELTRDTFVRTVYVTVEAWYQRVITPYRRQRRGPRPRYPDTVILSLALLAQWRPDRSERALVRYAQVHWQTIFPQIPPQCTFNRRVRQLEPVLAQLGPHLAQELARQTNLLDPTEVLDGTPVPLMRKCRGAPHKCFGDEAAFGCGGSDREWYYGMELVGAVNQAGAITGTVLVPANTEERFSVEALLGWRVDASRPEPTAAALEPILGKPHRGPRQGPTGPIATPLGAGAPAAGLYVADRGFHGRAWHQHWHAAFGATVITPADVPTPAAADTEGCPARRGLRRWLAQARHVIETVFGLLLEQFGLRFPRARTYAGVRSRVAAKVAAYNLLVLLNQRFARPAFAHFNPFD